MKAGNPAWCGGTWAHLWDTAGALGLDWGGNPEESAGGLGSAEWGWDNQLGSLSCWVGGSAVAARAARGREAAAAAARAR